MTGSSSVIIGVSTSGKHPSDSDVRLVPDNVKGASDSDVRLATPEPNFRAPSDSDVTLIKDDTADHGVISSSSGSDTRIRQSPLLGSSAEVPAGSQSDSDFDLNPSSELIDALQPDSGSDFELTALDASDEFEATPLSRPSDSDVTAADPNTSGINLSRPSDSGINLQGAGFGLGQADSIELAPLSEDELPTHGSKPSGKPSAKPSAPKKSLSATPPPAVKKGEKDIFDDTDFEVDVPLSDDDSDDQTMQLDAASDFELEESDSASEVFAIDEEAVDQNAATAMAPFGVRRGRRRGGRRVRRGRFQEMASAWSSPETSAADTGRSGPAVVLTRRPMNRVERALGRDARRRHAADAAHHVRLGRYDPEHLRIPAKAGRPSGLVRALGGMFGG